MNAETQHLSFWPFYQLTNQIASFDSGTFLIIIPLNLEMFLQKGHHNVCELLMHNISILWATASEFITVTRDRHGIHLRSAHLSSVTHFASSAFYTHSDPNQSCYMIDIVDKPRWKEDLGFQSFKVAE